MRTTPRRSMVIAFLAVALSLGAASCGHSTDGDMNHEVDRMMDHTASIDRAIETHASTTLAATNLTSVGVEETAHDNVMRGHMDSLDHVMDDMGTYCMGATSARDHTHEMRTAMTDMRAEHERHRTASRPDLAAARAEEERHVGELRAVLARMRAAGDGIRRDSGMDRCRHCC